LSTINPAIAPLVNCHCPQSIHKLPTSYPQNRGKVPSKIIVDNYNSDSFQIVRVNCDLVNSKYPEFQTKVKKGKTMKEAEIDFFIK
jgi:hypothetical protein